MPYPQPPNYWEQDEDPNDPLALSRKYAPMGGPPLPGRGPFANLPVGPGGGPALDIDAGGLPSSMPPAGGVPSLPRSMKQDNYISAPDPFLNDWNTAAARRDAQRAQKPTIHDKQYDIPAWQKMAMIGANAAAGLVNASGRTRVAPLDQQTMLRRPKYEAAMDLWETQGKSLDAELNSMTQKYNMKRQANQDEIANRTFASQQQTQEAQRGLIEAQTEQAKAHADLYSKGPNQRQSIWSTPRGLYSEEMKGIIPGTEPDPKQQTWTPEQKAQHWGKLADDMIARGLIKAGSMEEMHLRSEGNVPNPFKPDSGYRRPDHYEDQQDFNRWVKTQTQSEALSKREYGPNGLHQQQAQLDIALTKPDDAGADWKPDPLDLAKVDIVENEIAGVYRQRFANGELDRAQLDQLLQGLQNRKAKRAGKPVVPYSPQGPANPAAPSTPAAQGGGGAKKMPPLDSLFKRPPGQGGGAPMGGGMPANPNNPFAPKPSPFR